MSNNTLKACLLSCLLISTPALSSYKISSDKNLNFSLQNKQIDLLDAFIEVNETNIAANSITIFYKDFVNLQERVTKEDFGNFKRIEAKGNVILDFEGGAKVTGDQYINDPSKRIMVLRALNNNTKYTTSNYQIIAEERIEYIYDKKILAARGNPVIKIQEEAANYEISQGLISAHLTEDRNIKDIQLFDNIVITVENSDTSISGDYGYFDITSSKGYIEGSVVLKRGSETIVGCKLDIDLNSTDLILESCLGTSKLETTLQLGNETREANE